MQLKQFYQKVLLDFFDLCGLYEGCGVVGERLHTKVYVLDVCFEFHHFLDVVESVVEVEADAPHSELTVNDEGYVAHVVKSE